MKITSFLCCEYATLDSSGRATLVGAGTDLIRALEFPTSVRLYLFARCVPEVNDIPGDRLVHLDVVGSDRKIGEVVLPFKVFDGTRASSFVGSISLDAEGPETIRLDLSIEGCDQSVSWPLEFRSG